MYEKCATYLKDCYSNRDAAFYCALSMHHPERHHWWTRILFSCLCSKKNLYLIKNIIKLFDKNN